MKLINKFLSAVATFSFITLNSFAQNNSIVLDGAYIVLDGGTGTNKIHIVVDQPNPLGIVRLSGGHIHSENQYNSVKWLADTSTGNYVFPFGVGGNATDYIPFTFNKTTIGSADISMATWATNQQNFPKPAATNVAAVSNMIGITDSVLYAIDRFWDIQTSAATTANLTFSYRGSENTTASATSMVKAEHWNGTAWDTPVGPGTTGVTTGIGTAGPFINQSTFSPWTLIIPCAPVTNTLTAAICQGDSILLAGNYQTTAGNYNDTIYGGSSQGCDSIITTSLTINPSQTLTLTSVAGSDTQTICGFAPITNIIYTIGGGATSATISGLPSGLTSSFNIDSLTISGTPTVTGTFNYTVTTTGICIPAISTGTIIINTIPATPTVSGATYCEGSAISPMTASGTGGTYNWYSDSSLTILVSTGITYTPSTTTTATYYVTETVGGCTNAATAVTITINQLPNVSGGSSQTICQGDSVTLTGSGATNYSWSGGIINGTAFIPTTTNTYTVTGTDTNSCINTATITITVLTPPIANAGADVTICSGSNTTLTASGGASYLWDNGSPTASINVNPTITTMYYVTVSNGGCAANDTVIVNVISSPIISVSPDVTISQGTSTILTASGGTNYSWSNGETTNSISVAPLITTDYCVTASNSSCSTSACVKVTVDIKCGELFVPNGFSPNADGKNDVLEIYINKTCVKDFNFLIFDRWGEKIFESTNINSSWDGTYKGKALDAAVFVYYLNISLTNSTEPITLKGNVSIIK